MTLTNANTTDGATSDGTSSADGNADENSDENGAIHLDTVIGVHLTNVDINGTEQHGINGRNVTDLDLDGCTIQNTGNEIWESGIYIFQLPARRRPAPTTCGRTAPSTTAGSSTSSCATTTPPTRRRAPWTASP